KTRLELADELLDLLSQLRLREVQENDVLAVLFGLGLRLVADRVERRGDDFTLLLRQLADAVLAARASTTTHRLGLHGLVVLAERADLDEIDVACRRLRSGNRISVSRFRVVRDEIARLEAQLLQIDRVAGAYLGQRLRPAEQRHGLGRRAVRRIEQLQLLDA